MIAPKNIIFITLTLAAFSSTATDAVHPFANIDAGTALEIGPANDAGLFHTVEPFATTYVGKALGIEPANDAGLFLTANPTSNYAAVIGDELTENVRWRVIPGLTGQFGTITLEKMRAPGRYLRHRSYVLHADRYSDTDLNRNDATFRVVANLYNVAHPLFVSFESVNFPGHYIVRDGITSRIAQLEDNDSFRLRATWTITDEVDANC